MKRIVLLLIASLGISLLAAQIPTLNWVEQQSGSSGETAKTIVVDNSGNSYVLGFYSGTMDLDPGPGVVSVTTVGSSDVYLVKLNPNGQFIWGKSYGSSGADEGSTLCLDQQGFLYITGFFLTTIDFSGGTGTLFLNSFGDFDAFLLKLDTAGNEIWAKQFGGFMGIDEGKSVVVDDSSNVYLAGFFTGSADFDPSNNMFVLTAAGGSQFEGYVVKLDVNGDLVWAKQLGGTNADLVRYMAINSSGDLYITGTYRGVADLDPSANTTSFTSNGSDDVFIVKLNRSGNFIWAKSLGGSSSDLGHGITVDQFSYVIVAGQFIGSVDFDPGAGNVFMSSQGFYDSFVLKLDSSGNFSWVKRINSTSNVNSRFIKTDMLNQIYITGSYTGTIDLNPDTTITQNVSNAGSDDIFVLKMDENGSFVWGITMGGLNFDQATSMEVSDSLNVYLSGLFNSTMDFDPSLGTTTLSPTSSRDAFIAKYSNPLNTSSGELTHSSSTLRVYPNPTSKEVTIALAAMDEITTITIYSMEGVTVYQEEIRNPSNLTSVNLDGLAEGTYLLVAATKKSVERKKIVIR
ncbi:MAG: T9SS type A sorting domain-containing protein [Bacteroidia bacterium]